MSEYKYRALISMIDEKGGLFVTKNVNLEVEAKGDFKEYVIQDVLEMIEMLRLKRLEE